MFHPQIIGLSNFDISFVACRVPHHFTSKKIDESIELYNRIFQKEYRINLSCEFIQIYTPIKMHNPFDKSEYIFRMNEIKKSVN